MESTRDLLEKYDIRVLAHRVDALSADLSQNLLVYSQLQVMGQLAYLLYQAGRVDEAREALAEHVAGGEALLGGEVTDPLVRSQFADAFSRLAFISATLERFDEAGDLLRRSVAVALEPNWLQEFNGAYVAARQGRIGEAADLTGGGGG